MSASVGGGAKADFDASRSRAAAMVAAGLGACVGTAVAAGFGTAVGYSHGVSVVPPQAPIRNKQMQLMKMTFNWVSLISGNPEANLTP